MPVTVRELIVRATVTNSNHNSKGGISLGQTKMLAKERDSIINDCVEKVLEILDREKER